MLTGTPTEIRTVTGIQDYERAWILNFLATVSGLTGGMIVNRTAINELFD